MAKQREMEALQHKNAASAQLAHAALKQEEEREQDRLR